MEHYLAIRHLHITFVILSGSFFLLRGILMLRNSAWLQHKICKIAPHIIDSGLLGAAIYLAVTAKLNPAHTPWLAAKIIALILYIILGTIALKSSKTRQIRVSAFVAALATFAYIVGVAMSKSPLSWLA
jgi:uncharacterized membrane protein SirB2